MTDYDLRVAGGSLVTPSGVVQQDLLVAGGLVAAIVDPGAQASAADVVNAEGLHVFPGVDEPFRNGVGGAFVARSSKSICKTVDVEEEVIVEVVVHTAATPWVGDDACLFVHVRERCCPIQKNWWVSHIKTELPATELGHSMLKLAFTKNTHHQAA